MSTLLSSQFRNYIKYPDDPALHAKRLQIDEVYRASLSGLSHAEWQDLLKFSAYMQYVYSAPEIYRTGQAFIDATRWYWQNEDLYKLYFVSGGGSDDSAGKNEEFWSNSIRATQEVIPGTNIPKSFVMKGKFVNGKEIWVHGNATKHIGEFINSAGGSVLVENELMLSFNATIDNILLKSLRSGKNFFSGINGWEIGINADTGVIYHALYK